RIMEQSSGEYLSLARHNAFVLFTPVGNSMTIWQSLSAELMASVSFTGVSTKGRAFLDFSKLVPDVVHGEQWVVRYGHDGAGDDWINMTFFISSSIESRVRLIGDARTTMT